jgi:hypothetical protein
VKFEKIFTPGGCDRLSKKVRRLLAVELDAGRLIRMLAQLNCQRIGKPAVLEKYHRMKLKSRFLSRCSKNLQNFIFD